MDSVNDLLAEESIRHQVALQGYTTGVLHRMLALLNRSDTRLLDELSVALEQVAPTLFSMERLESLLTSVRSISAAIYQELGQKLNKELEEFVGYELSYQHQMLVSHVPVGVHVAVVSAPQVYAAAMSRPFQGVLLRQVWGDLDASKMKRVRQAIAQGYVEGKTTPQIIREIRGTKAKGYVDGLIEKDRRDVAAVVRTAIGHTAGFAQDKAMAANADIIKALQWSATLDLRTSPQCRIRDRLLYTPDDHKPIGHKVPWLSGPGRLHWRCRSGQVPVLKSFKELGIDIPEIEVGGKTRANMDGQLPADTSYADWIKKQSAARQDSVLGPTRGRLLREGKLEMADLYNAKGELLTLDDLKKQDAEAFKRAGV